jgi:hypothetical protein
MPSQGPYFAGTIVDDASVGTITWGNVSNAGATDSVYASSTSGMLTQSHYLKFTNFGFSIPTGATIDEIEIKVIRKGTASAVKDYRFRIVLAGAIGTLDYLDTNFWTATEETRTSTGLFEGAHYSAGDINNSGFGWAISVDHQAPGTADIDSLTMKVTYTTATAAITGTAAETTTNKLRESHIVAGGKTVIITLTGDTWVAAGATFDAQRQNIINGLDSAQAEAAGWDAEVKAKLAVTDVVRTSDTVVTVTLSAQAAFNITAAETITCTIPATALTGGNAIVATPTFRVLPDVNVISHLGGLGISRQPIPPRNMLDVRMGLVPQHFADSRMR